MTSLFHLVIFLHLIRKRKKQKNNKILSLLFVVAVREERISLRALAKRLGMSAHGVGYAVERGEAIVRESHYELIQ